MGEQNISKQSPEILIRSIKGEVKRKNFPNGWTFSSFAAHVNEQGLF